MSDKEYMGALVKLVELSNEWNAIIDKYEGFFEDYHIAPFGVPGTPFIEGWEFTKSTK